jgi:hypothetical protein
MPSPSGLHVMLKALLSGGQHEPGLSHSACKGKLCHALFQAARASWTMLRAACEYRMHLGMCLRTKQLGKQGAGSHVTGYPMTRPQSCYSTQLDHEQHSHASHVQPTGELLNLHIGAPACRPVRLQTFVLPAGTIPSLAHCKRVCQVAGNSGSYKY